MLIGNADRARAAYRRAEDVAGGPESARRILRKAASARTALLRKLLATAAAWLDTEVGTEEAARESGRCAESVRRAVRSGLLPDRRPGAKGRHRIRRGDLMKLAAPQGGPYDPIADVQDIARLRRKL